MQPKSSNRAPAERRLQSDAEALHGALSSLVRVYQFRDRDKICCYDISVTQCYALEALAERGPMRLQALAALLMLDKSTITRVVDALQRKGHVDRRVDPDDARALALSVTRSGRALYQKINRELVQQQAELIRGLSPEVRSSVIEVIRSLALRAEQRFLSGVSVGPPSCAADADRCAS